MAVYSGSGSTLSVDGTVMGNVVSVDISGYTREAIGVTHLGDVVKKYRQSTQLDGGTVSITYDYDPVDVEAKLLKDKVLDGGADITFVLTYEEGDTDTFDGVPTSWSPSNITNEDSDNLQATVEIQITGDVVFAVVV